MGSHIRHNEWSKGLAILKSRAGHHGDLRSHILAHGGAESQKMLAFLEEQKITNKITYDDFIAKLEALAKKIA